MDVFENDKTKVKISIPNFYSLYFFHLNIIKVALLRFPKYRPSQETHPRE